MVIEGMLDPCASGRTHTKDLLTVTVVSAKLHLSS